MKSQLKNRHAYAQKHGFLQDIAHSGIQASDDDMDIEDYGSAGENSEKEDDDVVIEDNGNAGAGENSEEEDEVDATWNGSQHADSEEDEDNTSGINDDSASVSEN